MGIEIKRLKKVVIREELYALTNDTIETILLGQLIYWQDKVRDIDKYIEEERLRCNNDGTSFIDNSLHGWIYKTTKDMVDECMLNISEATARRYLKKLIDLKYISCRNNPIHKWDKTLQYRVNIEYILNCIKSLGYDGLNFDFINNDINKSYKDQLKDKRWKKLANKIRKRDNYTCQKCGSHEHLQVHHKKYIKGRLAWEYDESNLITLCSECHKKIHNIE